MKDQALRPSGRRSYQRIAVSGMGDEDPSLAVFSIRCWSCTLHGCWTQILVAFNDARSLAEKVLVILWCSEVANPNANLICSLEKSTPPTQTCRPARALLMPERMRATRRYERAWNCCPFFHNTLKLLRMARAPNQTYDPRRQMASIVLDIDLYGRPVCSTPFPGWAFLRVMSDGARKDR